MEQHKDIPTRGLDKAYDAMKHIATLCTGVITLTITFADKFKVKDEALAVPDQLLWAWLAYTVALVFSLWAIFAITGSVNQVDTDGASNDIMTFNIRFPSSLALVSFAIAVVLTGVAGYKIAA